MTARTSAPYAFARKGFTMVELMVAATIMAIVAAQVLATFSNQMETYVAQKRVSDVQEDARLAAEIITRDLRLAGFMVPPMLGIATRDGDTAAADALCTSDSSVISDASLDTATARFDGAPLVVALGAAATSVVLAIADLDIDGDSTDDFSVNRGIIISDGDKSHCARITDITGAVISFAPATPAGFTTDVGPGRAVPAVIYEVTTAGLLRNSLLVTSMVEDLQLEFAVDNDGDGSIGNTEFPIHDLTGSNRAEIAGVQLSVLARSDTENPSVEGPGRQALANRTAGVPDGFRRRLVSLATASRNLQ